jgi:hypothetical protein
VNTVLRATAKKMLAGTSSSWALVFASKNDAGRVNNSAGVLLSRPGYLSYKNR